MEPTNLQKTGLLNLLVAGTGVWTLLQNLSQLHRKDDEDNDDDDDDDDDDDTSRDMKLES